MSEVPLVLGPHGVRLVHLIITMIKLIRTSRLSIKNSLSVGFTAYGFRSGA
jgi:hypothetical protein